MRRMLCTLGSGALRRGAGQLKITWLPRWTPDSNSVRCWTRSMGGSGGRRLPQLAAKKTSNGNRATMIDFRGPRIFTLRIFSRDGGGAGDMNGFTEYTG